MKILGIDFTSRPSRRKPITCLHCDMEGATLRARSLDKWVSFREFEAALAKSGPWLAGIDFPFGQARRFIETIGWPQNWSAYVAHAHSLGRDGLRATLTHYKCDRPPGEKGHLRATDEVAASVSPQKLYGVPVGLMFFEGASRLVAAGVTIPHLQEGDPNRIVVEAYPGVLARDLIGRRSYKTDTKKKRTADQQNARASMLQQLALKSPTLFGFTLVFEQLRVEDDAGADDLDALLCAVQAAWAWRQREQRYGAPQTVDALVGSIAHPLKVTRPKG